jgi:argininosuccinate lyase
MESVLEIGGRLAEPPSAGLTAIFAAELAGQAEFFDPLGLVDLAHCLTLSEQGVIPPGAARALVQALLELHRSGTAFTPEAALGDLYTNREAWLARRTAAAGWLGTARARREALTTAFHLLLRDRLLELGAALLDFGQSVATVASRHSHSLMPDYTYLQIAQPTTLGHYLSAFAWPALRDLERVKALYERIDRCPAGCGSSNGSVALQDRAAQARRLGFAAPVRHARDAMWQPDLAIEAMGLAVAAAVGLDRLAEDLMIFATAEFGLVRVADRHARASKIMPQKRNPFALSYLRGLANRLIGEQAGVAASGRTPSGQMDNRMLPYEAVPAALRSVAQAASLMAEIVEELTFESDQAELALSDGTACATDLAERLCLALRLDYRAAHRLVGGLVRRLEAEGRSLSSLTLDKLRAACAEAGLEASRLPDGFLEAALDPWAGVTARQDVGGAAPEELAAALRELGDALTPCRRWLEEARSAQEAARRRLLTEAEAMGAGGR